MTQRAEPNEILVCSICRENYTGYGNNAQPVNDGRCCDFCNNTVVIPARLQMIMRHEPKVK